MGTLFNVSDLGDILTESVPRTYKTTRIVDGKVRQVYILPTIPTMKLTINDDHIKVFGLVHRFESSWYSGSRGAAAQGELLTRLKTLMEESYLGYDVIFSRETNKFNIYDTAMTYHLKFDKKLKMVSTSDLQTLVEMFKGVYEFGKIQRF